MVSKVLKSEGGFVWACKGYDGEVQSSFIGQSFGSIGLMTSLIESTDGLTLCETLHGSVPKHFKNHYLLKETSTNSISTIFAWTKALYARAKLD